MEKDKTRTQYIADIYDLAKMEFSQQSIDKAGEIIDYLRDPLVEWQLRRMSQVIWFSAGGLFSCAVILLAQLLAQ